MRRVASALVSVALSLAALLPGACASKAAPVVAGPAGAKTSGAGTPGKTSAGAGADATTGATPRRPRPAVAEHAEREARHLRNVRVLTSEGRNGEGYFAPDGEQIIFQSIRGASPYYQMYVMNADGTERLVSTGRGKCTCGFFRPDGRKIIYASTHADPRAFRPGVDPRPPEPPRGERYKWDFDTHMDIFEAEPDGTRMRRLTVADGYDAEGSYSHAGRDIVFTSTRDGDGEIYVMDAGGGHARRLTHAPGYDGGPFFSPDDSLIVFRGFRWGRDDRAEIFVVRPDGTGEKQLTDLGVVSWAPFFHPDGRRIVFAANLEGHNFELVLMNADGSGLERVTYEPRFDGLPSFSPDGRRLLWTTNRGPGGDPERGVSQIAVADWVD